MNLIFDFIVLAILCVCIFLGKKNGIIKTVFSLFGSIVAFILTALFVKPVAAFLTDRFFFPFFKDRFFVVISDIGGETSSSFDFSLLPESARKILYGFGVDVDDLNEFVTSHTESAAESLADSLGRYAMMPVAQAVGYACAFIALFLVFTIAIRILVRMLDLVAKIPGLRFANTTLGILVGAVEGCFLAVVVSSFLMIAAPAMQGSEIDFLRTFDPDNTILIRFFSQFNWLSSAFLKG